MFSIQYGTAQDVLLLVSLLPAYLPAALRVELWACVGVSLGGHSTWLALLHDPRIAVGVPIIGCCDYLSLMRNRLRGMLLKSENESDDAGDEEAEAERKYLPDALKSALRLLDAGCMGEPAVQRLKTRKLLVLCGSDDRLVPYHCSQPFIERLQRAMAAPSRVNDELEAAADHLHHQSGVCEVVVETGKGHELTDSMVTAAGDWLLRWACSAAAAGHDSRL
jgi:dienelactone hydrolase